MTIIQERPGRGVESRQGLATVSSRSGPYGARAGWRAEGLTERKAAAGRLLFDACEAVLGVEGPAALARETRRSKAWSKLRSGKGGDLPDWAEITGEVLCPGMAPDVLGALNERHREAWLRLHDPDLLDAEPLLALPPLRTDSLQAFGELLRSTMAGGEYGTARQALRFLEQLLTRQDPALLSRPQLALLGQFLTDLSICAVALGQQHEALAAARAGAAYSRQAGQSAAGPEARSAPDSRPTFFMTCRRPLAQEEKTWSSVDR